MVPIEPQPSIIANESDAWRAVYLDEKQQRRRLAAMRDKFQLLGLDKLSRDAKVLDLCCGAGEALVALSEMGFQDLSGIDISVPKPLKDDSRFEVFEGNALATGLPGGQYDLVLNIHSMHHFASAENVGRFLQEAKRLLRPGGRLAIIDFPNSPQIRLAFWFFRQNLGLVTPYLRFFGSIIQEEWHFLKNYLPQWPKVRSLLHNGEFEVISHRKTLFYFYIVLRKPFPDRIVNEDYL
jgi:ubiquinone/menaquinone biosynthesis C-methylase UbiE